jgi:hypothetical protein
MSDNNTFSIDKEFILKAHGAACDNWKKQIEEKFPELFQDDRYNFTQAFTITTSFGGNPIAILNGLAKDERDQHRGLIVDKEYEVVVRNDAADAVGYTVIEFHKKK